MFLTNPKQDYDFYGSLLNNVFSLQSRENPLIPRTYVKGRRRQGAPLAFSLISMEPDLYLDPDCKTVSDARNSETFKPRCIRTGHDWHATDEYADRDLSLCPHSHDDDDRLRRVTADCEICNM